MAPQKSLTYRDIIDSIKKKQIAQVYILMGDEPYFIDLITDLLEKTVVAEDNKAFDQLVFYGADADMDVVAASARQYPVMGDRQLVILKEAQSLTNAKSTLDRLAPYLSQPNSRGVLVIAFKGDSLNATSQLLKAASRLGENAVVFKSERFRDYQLSAPIKDYCRQRKVGIDEDAVRILIDYIGNPLKKLFGEIDKLILAGGPGFNRITAAQIEENIGISKEFNNYELTKALSHKDYPKSMQIIEYFRKNPKNNPTMMTTGVLLKFFTQLVIAHFTQDKSDRSLMEALQLKSTYALTEIRAGLQMYTPRQAMAAISALRDFDCKSKGIGSFQNEYDLQRELFFRIFTVS